MPAETTTATVTLDRQAVLELLVDATAAVDVIEELADHTAATFTQELERKIDSVAHAALGSGETEGGPRQALWTDGERRARAVVTALTTDAQERLAAMPLKAQMLAVRLIEVEITEPEDEAA